MNHDITLPSNGIVGWVTMLKGIPDSTIGYGMYTALRPPPGGDGDPFGPEDQEREPEASMALHGENGGLGESGGGHLLVARIRTRVLKFGQEATRLITDCENRRWYMYTPLRQLAAFGGVDTTFVRYGKWLLQNIKDVLPLSHMKRLAILHCMLITYST